ncbi:OPT oligopeptide transporter protein-domain-containing protein [Suillus lakei]|nr:OPT oligopeptide transporter protein-domain-containing protein [Suillus lakei]
MYIYRTSLSTNTIPSSPSLSRARKMTTVTCQGHDQVAYAQSVSSHSEKEKSAMATDIISVSGDSEGKLEPHVQSINTDDPFPESPDAPVEDQQLTVRAVLVGCILGGIVAASNIYLGLKTGWTFGSSLFGAILGFAILKPLSRSAPTFLGGGYFGPKENNVCQSAATSAGSLGLLFTSGFPPLTSSDY